MSTLHAHPRVAGAQGLLTPESQTGDGEKPHGSPGPTPSTMQVLSVAGAGTRKHPETDKQCLQKVCLGSRRAQINPAVIRFTVC